MFLLKFIFEIPKVPSAHYEVFLCYFVTASESVISFIIKIGKPTTGMNKFHFFIFFANDKMNFHFFTNKTPVRSTTSWNILLILIFCMVINVLKTVQRGNLGFNWKLLSHESK